jgi:phosphoribosylformimino-5-aminoimidazole carboxamide ribotide isomerase
VHFDWIERIVKATSLKVQVGGGIRTLEAARQWLSVGANRVVFGTAAVGCPEVVQNLCCERPGAVIVAIDANDGRVAIEGWLKDSGYNAVELAREVDQWGVSAILYTNIARDGTRMGPDIEGTDDMQRQVKATVIASGGIGTLDDLRALQAANIRAAVCGRALYTGAFSFREANEMLARGQGMTR